MELLSKIPDMRSGLVGKKFKKPVGAKEKKYFICAIIWTIICITFVLLRVGTHVFLSGKTENLINQTIVFRKQIAAKQNELKEVYNAKEFFEKMQDWTKNKPSYYRRVVCVFDAFPQTLAAQEIIFDENKTKIKLGQVVKQKIGKELRYFYKALRDKLPEIIFSEKTIKNRLIICGTKKQN